MAPYRLEWSQLLPSYVFSRDSSELLYVDADPGALMAVPSAGGKPRDVYVGKVGHVHRDLEDGWANVFGLHNDTVDSSHSLYKAFRPTTCAPQTLRSVEAWRERGHRSFWSVADGSAQCTNIPERGSVYNAAARPTSAGNCYGRHAYCSYSADVDSIG